MVAPIIIPEPQFCDADGNPYAGGTIATYIPGTSTPKDVWVDPDQTSLATNPIVLDAAGRCIMWGDGEYRLVLRDAAGNLIWDQPATTIVSAAMQPVVEAATIAEAQSLLGITDAVQTETNRAIAAENTLQNAINAETTRATNAENTNAANIAAESNRAQTEETGLQNQITALGATSIKSGTGTTDSTGHVRINYPTAFPTATIAVTVTNASAALTAEWPSVVVDASGFDCYMSLPLSDGSVHPAAMAFYWIATGY